MSEENRKWLERLIKENKESPNELTYTYCPFEILYQLQQENQQLKKQKEIIDKAIEYIRENSKKYYRDWGQDDCSTEIYLDEDEVFKLLGILEDKEV